MPDPYKVPEEWCFRWDLRWIVACWKLKFVLYIQALYKGKDKMKGDGILAWTGMKVEQKYKSKWEIYSNKGGKSSEWMTGLIKKKITKKTPLYSLKQRQMGNEQALTINKKWLTKVNCARPWGKRSDSTLENGKTIWLLKSFGEIRVTGRCENNWFAAEWGKRSSCRMLMTIIWIYEDSVL